MTWRKSKRLNRHLKQLQELLSDIDKHKDPKETIKKHLGDYPDDKAARILKRIIKHKRSIKQQIKFRNTKLSAADILKHICYVEGGTVNMGSVNPPNPWQ